MTLFLLGITKRTYHRFHLARQSQKPHEQRNKQESQKFSLRSARFSHFSGNRNAVATNSGR